MKKQMSTEPLTEAGLFKRLGAFLIDAAILVFVTSFASDRFDLTLVLPKYKQFHLYILGGHFYFIFTILPHSIFSQTLGQMILRIKVVDHTQKRLGLLRCLMRDVIFRPIGLLTTWMMLFGNRTALHDRMVGALVVEAK